MPISRCIASSPQRRRVVALCAVCLAAASVDFVASPSAAASPTRLEGRHCALTQPPAAAGAYVTPGGFLLVYPRNAEIGERYSGCRLIWVMQEAAFTPLLLRAQYRRGVLYRVQGYDGRGGDNATTCTLPTTDPACAGLASHELLVLNLPTWPRVCTVDPAAAACRADPE
jgi:hypothetical protein